MSNITPQPNYTPAQVFDGDDPNWAIAAKQPPPPAKPAPAAPAVVRPPNSASAAPQQFTPREPASFRDAGLREPQVEALVLKFLLNSGGNTGREIAQQLALPFGILEGLLQIMKLDQLIVYRGASVVGDFVYELTARGAERARSHANQSTYFGSAPVPLADYIESIEAQSVRHQKPRLGDVKRTFKSLVLNEKMQRQIGEAVNLGKGFFLHGAPGNGKTCIAELVTSIYSEGIWIPRAIQASGEITRVYDPTKHEVIAWNEERSIGDSRIDARWVYIKRPTIMVGGELRLENLEVATNEVTGISEAPIQLKANCGTLVIDDFGRQKFDIEALLNRLIIPLERREDVLNLPSGRSFSVPFDLLIVFSTNLSPESLIDEAFLRRVPFTIRADDPTEAQFREVFQLVADKHELKYDPTVLDYLIDKHYKKAKRPFRFCQPRDILQQVNNSCDFAGTEKVVTKQNIDSAIENCLAIQLDN